MRFIKFFPSEAFQRAKDCGPDALDGIEVEGGFEVSLPERLDANGWPVCPVVVVTEKDGQIQG